MATTLGQCEKELDVNYVILSVITNSCELRYCSTLVLHMKCRLLISVLFTSLFIVEKSKASNDNHWTLAYNFLAHICLGAGGSVSVVLLTLCSEINSNGKQLFVRRRC